MMSKEAMKLALEALEAGEYYIDDLEAIVYAADDLGTHEDRAKMQAAITALREALAEQPAQPQQEHVAWLHTKIEGVVVPHRPVDLDKHPDRWEALYKNTPPCPTCEALARTVMMDQTGRDA